MNQPQRFPAGWDEAQVRAVASHYNNQTEDEQAEEIEAAVEAEGMTFIAVPAELVDQVRAMVAQRKSA